MKLISLFAKSRNSNAKTKNTIFVNRTLFILQRLNVHVFNVKLPKVHCPLPPHNGLQTGEETIGFYRNNRSKGLKKSNRQVHNSYYIRRVHINTIYMIASKPKNIYVVQCGICSSTNSISNATKTQCYRHNIYILKTYYDKNTWFATEYYDKMV